MNAVSAMDVEQIITDSRGPIVGMSGMLVLVLHPAAVFHKPPGD